MGSPTPALAGCATRSIGPAATESTSYVILDTWMIAGAAGLEQPDPAGHLPALGALGACVSDHYWL